MGQKRIIILSPADYARFVQNTEAFTILNPTFKNNVRDMVQPNKDLPTGTALINGKKVVVKQ